MAPQIKNIVRQTGTVTPGHVPVWTTDGIVGDGGTSARGVLTTLGITSAGDTSFAINGAPVTGPYSALSLGINNTSNALISVDSFGGAPQLGLYFRINGNVSGFHINPDGSVTIPSTGTQFSFIQIGLPPNNTLTLSPGATSADPITFVESGTGGYSFDGPVSVTRLNVSNIPSSKPDGSPPDGAQTGDLYTNGGFVCIAP